MILVISEGLSGENTVILSVEWWWFFHYSWYYLCALLIVVVLPWLLLLLGRLVLAIDIEQSSWVWPIKPYSWGALQQTSLTSTLLLWVFRINATSLCYCLLSHCSTELAIGHLRRVSFISMKQQDNSSRQDCVDDAVVSHVYNQPHSVSWILKCIMKAPARGGLMVKSSGFATNNGMQYLVECQCGIIASARERTPSYESPTCPLC